MSKVGMIILNYNDLQTTKKYINNIKDYKVLDKIIIVDNKSTDNSYEELKKLSNDKISVIETDDNKGYALSCNRCRKEMTISANITGIVLKDFTAFQGKKESWGGITHWPPYAGD